MGRMNILKHLNINKKPITVRYYSTDVSLLHKKEELEDLLAWACVYRMHSFMDHLETKSFLGEPVRRIVYHRVVNECLYYHQERFIKVVGDRDWYRYVNYFLTIYQSNCKIVTRRLKELNKDKLFMQSINENDKEDIQTILRAQKTRDDIHANYQILKIISPLSNLEVLHLTLYIKKPKITILKHLQITNRRSKYKKVLTITRRYYSTDVPLLKKEEEELKFYLKCAVYYEMDNILDFNNMSVCQNKQVRTAHHIRAYQECLHLHNTGVIKGIGSFNWE